jgi:hypothetical protein
MHLKTLGLALAISGITMVTTVVAAGAQVVNSDSDNDLAPTGKGWGAHVSGLEKANRKPKPRPPVASNGINYHNGPVMLGNVNVYLIWYGNWDGNNTVDILTDEAKTIGKTPWYNINTTYWNKTNQRPSNLVTYVKSTTDNYSRGTSLSDSAIGGIVGDAINSGRLPKDANGVYFVLSSQDVEETSGFCSDYCGWHTSGALGKLDVKYAFVGSADRCLNVCSRQRFRSPNDNPSADGMASVFAHELSEAVTDPDLNAWYDSRGEENADKCAWTFGTMFTAANGSGANVHWGDRDFLVQRNWINAGGGSCVVSYP